MISDFLSSTASHVVFFTPAVFASLNCCMYNNLCCKQRFKMQIVKCRVVCIN